MNDIHDSLEGNIQHFRMTRSRFHYKPISSPEFILTTALSICMGLGMFALTTVVIPQNDFDLQVESETTQQCADSFSPNRCQNL